MNLIICVNCSRDFNPKIKTKIVKEDVRHYYYRCVYCNRKYNVTYTNKSIEARIIKIQNMQKEMEILGRNSDSLPLVQVIYDRMKNMIEQNGIEMKKLKKKMEEKDDGEEFES